jgi:hypothetical protein
MIGVCEKPRIVKTEPGVGYRAAEA